MKIDYEKMGYLKQTTFGEYIKEWAEIYQDRIAVVDDDIEVTYQELHRNSSRLAKGFQNLGIKAGDRVAIQLPNSIQFIYSCFALLKIQAIPILILPAMREQEVIGLFETGKPVAYIIPKEFLGEDFRTLGSEVMRKCDYVKHLIVDGDEVGGIMLSSLFADEEFEIKGGFAREIAFLLLSGGTTKAIPKLIPRTHQGYAYTAQAGADKCDFTADTVYLATLPIEHNFPLGNPGILGTFFKGGKVVLSKTTSADETFLLIEEQKVTDTSIVPSILKLWIEEAQYEEYDLSSLKVIMVGGAKLDAELAKLVGDVFHCKLRQVFGTAEGLNTCTSIEDSEEVILTTQGKPFSEADEIKIVDEYGKEVENGAIGQLLLRGPYTIEGYYNAPEQNKTSFTEDGFYLSGDSARLTEDGNLILEGRIVDQINRGGEKISPEEVEEILLSNEDVKDVAVVGIKDKSLGEKIAAFIVMKDKVATEQEIREYFIEKKVTHYKIPDVIRFIEKLPLTKIGKIDRKSLRNILEN